MLFSLLLACVGATDDSGVGKAPNVTIPFRASVGGAPFACGTTYDGVGTTSKTIDPLDFRLYVYDVGLVDAAGAVTNVELQQDREWQYQNVALLDFEDGSGSCATGSPNTNAEIVGSAPEGDYTGVTFKVGIPPELNHIDAATAPAPLNDTGLWWAWTSGYKFARIDVATTVNPSFFFHLGATDCTVSDAGDYACGLDNLAAVTLDIDPASEVVTLDLLDLYADNDLDAPVDYVTDYVSGCMAFAGDPECEGLMPKLGLPWGSVQDVGEQTFFGVEAQ